MIIELGHRANGAARAAHGVGLINRDRRQNAFDPVDHRLIHAVQELSGVGREGFDVSTLPLRIERVKGERAFARAAYARHNGQLACIEGDIEVF